MGFGGVFVWVGKVSVGFHRLCIGVSEESSPDVRIALYISRRPLEFLGRLGCGSGLPETPRSLN